MALPISVGEGLASPASTAQCGLDYYLLQLFHQQINQHRFGSRGRTEVSTLADQHLERNSAAGSRRFRIARPSATLRGREATDRGDPSRLIRWRPPASFGSRSAATSSANYSDQSRPVGWCVSGDGNLSIWTGPFSGFQKRYCLSRRLNR